MHTLHLLLESAESMQTDTTISEWNAALEAVAEDLLEEAGIMAPPVDAAHIARRLRIMVAIDRSLQPRGMHKRLSGRSSIFVRPDDRPERLQWAVAHELGESTAYRVCEKLMLPDEDVAAADRETWANLLAARLMLPRQWFFEDATRLNGDVLELKTIYRTSSHEAIAWRLLDLPRPTVITIFDQGHITSRRANTGFSPPQLETLEKNCWQDVHQVQKARAHCQSGLQVQCWPVHEAGWRREILRTTTLDEFADAGTDDWD